MTTRAPTREMLAEAHKNGGHALELVPGCATCQDDVDEGLEAKIDDLVADLIILEERAQVCQARCLDPKFIADAQDKLRAIREALRLTARSKSA